MTRLRTALMALSFTLGLLALPGVARADQGCAWEGVTLQRQGTKVVSNAGFNYTCNP
jgi:hypothetical protein